MRKIILSMQLSLDGVVSDPEKWMDMTDEIIEDSIAHYNTLDGIIIGGNSYAGLAGYWQNAENASNSAIERRFAKVINDIKKFVISRSKVDLVWKNSEQLAIDGIASLTREIEKLKKGGDKNLSVDSGIKTWQLFLQHDLFDELIVGIHPVIASKGEKLFDDIKSKTNLQLTTSKVYHNGVINNSTKRNSEDAF